MSSYYLFSFLYPAEACSSQEYQLSSVTKAHKVINTWVLYSHIVLSMKNDNFKSTSKCNSDCIPECHDWQVLRWECGTMLGICFYGCGCLFWRKTLIKGLRVRFPPRKAKSQSRTEETSRQNRAVSRREQELGACGLRAGLANVRGWVSVLDGFVGISLEYALAIAHRCRESYTKVLQTSPFLHMELTQVHACFFVLLFFHPLGCVCSVLWVCKEMWNAPGRRWEKPLDDRMV